MSSSRTKYCVMKCKYDEKEYDDISFHSFPKDEQKRQLWIEATNKKDWVPLKSAKLCSLHFESRYIDRFYGKATLRNLAIPTIFDHGNDGLVRGYRRKHSSEIVKPLEPQDLDMKTMYEKSPSPMDLIISEIQGGTLSSALSQSPNVTPSVKSVYLADVDERSVNTIPLSACGILGIPTTSDNYDKQHLEEHKYTSEIEILDDVDVKSENECLQSHVGTEDPLQCNDEKIFASPIDTIDEKLVEIPDSGIDQYQSIDYHEPTSTIPTDLDSCCRLCLGALTSSDIHFLTELKYDEIPILNELNILIDDGLPQRICENCFRIFEIIKMFLQQARQSQEFLVQHFSTRTDIKMDPDKINDDLSSEFKDILDNGTSCVANETETNPIKIEGCLEVNVPDIQTVECSETKIIVNPDRYCEICDKIFADKVYKMTHMQLHSNNNFECDFCGSSYKTKPYLLRHMRIHHFTIIRTCLKCNAKFTNPYRYHYHLKTHNPDRKYKCQYCKKSFLQQHHLKVHENGHTGAKPYLCFVCGQRYRHPSNYNSHIMKHKNGTIVNKVTVGRRSRLQQTGEGVKGRYLYRKPITSLPTYNCHICSKSFRLPAALENHLVKHTDERNYKCSTCSAAFKRYTHLQSHIRFVHLKEKPFKCTVCGQQFAIHGGLVEHMTSHSDERPFECDLCPAKYRTKRSIRIHMRAHSGEKPYQCSYCDKSFAAHTSMIGHNMTHTVRDR